MPDPSDRRSLVVESSVARHHHANSGSGTAATAAAIAAATIEQLRSELEASESARRHAESQLESAHAALAASALSHSNDLADANRIHLQSRDELERSTRLREEKLIREHHEEVRALKEDASAINVSILRNMLEAKEAQLQQAHHKYELQSAEVQKLTISEHRLQTAVDLINRQIRFAEDYKTILKYVTAKLYLTHYRYYKSTRDMHKSFGDLLRLIASEEKRSWRAHHLTAESAAATATQPHEQSEEQQQQSNATVTVTVTPAGEGEQTPRPIAQAQAHTAQSLSHPPAPPAAHSPRDRSPVVDDSESDDRSSSLASGFQQNELGEWLALDRALWVAEKAMFASAAAARRERCERIDYRLQYHIQSPSAITSTSTDYKRLRSVEKRLRSFDDVQEKRTTNLFSHLIVRRQPMLSEALPIITIALTNAFERERMSFVTTKLFREQHTTLLLDHAKSHESTYEAKKEVTQLKRQVQELRSQLEEARSKVCPCTIITLFQAQTQRTTATSLCVCECVHDCQCAKKEMQQRQQRHAQATTEEDDKNRPEEKQAQTTPAEANPSTSTHDHHRSSSSSSSSSVPTSLVSLTSRFSTSLGSGRNGRTHARLNEHSNTTHHSYETQHQQRHANSNRTTPSSSSSSKAPDDISSVPFLQRTIKSLRSRLHAARSTILTLQGEMVAAGLREQSQEMSQLGATLSVSPSQAQLAKSPSQRATGVNGEDQTQQHQPTHSYHSTHHPRHSSSSTHDVVPFPPFGSSLSRFDSHSYAHSHSGSTGTGSGSTNANTNTNTNTGHQSAHHLASSRSLQQLALPIAAAHGPISSNSRPELVASLENDLQSAWQQSVEISRYEYDNSSVGGSGSVSRRSSLPHPAPPPARSARLDRRQYPPPSIPRSGTGAGASKSNSHTPRTHMLHALEETPTIRNTPIGTNNNHHPHDDARRSRRRPITPLEPLEPLPPPLL